MPYGTERKGKNMKKIITVLLSLSMAVSSIGTLAFAEGETTSYNVGDLVWSENFESFEDGYDYAANPTNGITFSASSGDVVGSAKIKEDASDNSYLYVSAENSKGTGNVKYNLIVPAGAAAQGDDAIFTIDVDMKLDEFDAADVKEGKAAEYYFGPSPTATGSGSYVALSPTSSNNTTTSGLGVHASASYPRLLKSTFVHRIKGEEVQAQRLAANAWNTYRFIARKMVATAEDVAANSSLTEGETYYYADMYVNGQYYYLIAQRAKKGAVSSKQSYFVFQINFNPGITKGGACIDNLKCYYGAVESNDYVTKGEFTVDKYTFDECTAGTYEHINDKGTYRAVVTGESADHAFGVIKRYNQWGMNLDINSGKAGKAAGDNSLSVYNGGRIMFDTTNTVKEIKSDGTIVNYTGTAVNSVKNGTWVPEGDSLEFSADVLFKDIKENWLFECITAANSQNIAIEVTPNFYSTGHWESPEDFGNHRQRIAPKIPLNTWVNLRVIITRGTSDTYNKLTIYADDNVVCENQDITTWYKTFTTDENGNTVRSDAGMGDILSKGLSTVYFQGECDYDNITIKKYLLGQDFTKPETVPALVNASTKVADYPSLRGKVYTDGRSIQTVIDAMSITGDYVVRDASGNAVTDYTKPADGNYIEFDANGKKYYGAFVANNVVETINETSGALGGFTFDETAVAVESVTKGAGREANDTSILIKNINGEAPERANYVDGPRFVKELNTDENAYMEFSFLADENIDFTVGYSVAYVREGNKEGYSTKNGAGRAYCDNIRISENVVQSTNSDNGYMKAGTYKNGEWTKVRFEWNSMNNNCIAVSVNDGTPVLMNNGIPAYLKTLKQITITPAKNTSVVLDDIVVMEGYKSAPKAATISDITEKYVYNVDGVLSIPADMSNVYMSMNALGSSIGVSPLAASKKWIKADGSVASGNFDAVDRLVLLNDGIYTYYTVKNREGITEFKNADGTSKMVIDVTNANVTDLTGSKLISAVYNKEDGTLVSTAIHDITFEEEIFTSEVEITPQSYDSATQTMKYFAWKLDDVECLCNAYVVK